MNRKWRIKILQYECNHPAIAPEGCLQVSFGWFLSPGKLWMVPGWLFPVWLVPGRLWKKSVAMCGLSLWKSKVSDLIGLQSENNFDRICHIWILFWLQYCTFIAYTFYCAFGCSTTPASLEMCPASTGSSTTIGKNKIVNLKFMFVVMFGQSHLLVCFLFAIETQAGHWHHSHVLQPSGKLRLQVFSHFL